MLRTPAAETCRGRRPHHRRTIVAEDPRPRRPAPRACGLGRPARKLDDEIAALTRPAPYAGERQGSSAGRARRRHRSALPQLRPARHRFRRVRLRPAARPFQPVLYRSLAARCRLARRPTRATARSSSGSARSRRLPEKADFRDWKRGWLSVYGSNAAEGGGMAPPRRPHAARGRRQRRRQAASPISTRTSPSGFSSRAATTRLSMCSARPSILCATASPCSRRTAACGCTTRPSPPSGS